jgi:hypothetical protein
MNQYPPSGYGYPPVVPPPAPRRGPLGIILLVLGLLLVAAGLIVGLAGQGGGGKTTTNNNNPNQSTHAPNATASFTRTPRPTNTPQPPTATAQPLGQIYGGWEQTDPSTGSTVRFEFYPDGTVVITMDTQSVSSTFEIVDADTITILPDVNGYITASLTLDYVVNGNTITLTANGESQDLTRVW